MATAAEVARLAAATGVEAGRLFLALMIRHHPGAISMVDDHLLTATDGAGVEEAACRHLGDPDQADQPDAGSSTD